MLNSHSYETTYNIKDFKIEEKYLKEKDSYEFLIKKGNIVYPYIILNNYLRERNLINDIKVYTDKDEVCILPESDALSFYPLCSLNEEVYSANLSNIKTAFQYKKLSKDNRKYKDITINTIADFSFLLFNYKGFYLINQDKTNNINLFKQDVYKMDLIYQKDNYLLIPDYNQEFYFNKFYLINMLNGKIKEVDSESDISFDSVFLGDYKNKVYLLDQKEEQEYSIDLKKLKIKNIDFQILENNKFIKKSYKEIVRDHLNFLPQNIFDYRLENNTLYLVIEGTKVKISNKKVDKIVEIIDDTVFYLEGDKLYLYAKDYGEILLLSNFEWNFNNNNMIFIYQ